MAIRLFHGGDAVSVQRRRCHLTGPRMFSAAYGPKSRYASAEQVRAVVGRLDSGAFSDPPAKRLTPEAALDRQLAWEARAARLWPAPIVAESFVSYDLLIDEKWTGGRRRKERWSVAEADRAVRATVDAAAYLSAQRQRLAPRRLVLACQGVDAVQYEECAAGVLASARPGDVLGLGGWCILGQWRSWLPVFWGAMRRTLPRIAAAGLTEVHIFGVLWRPALGPLLHLCDALGLSLSTDSSAPLLAPCFPDQTRSAALAPTWEDNVRLWTEALATLRASPYYREPPRGRGQRLIQGQLFADEPARA